MTQTAIWPWPKRTYGASKVTFGADELAFIRSLTVSWSTAEHGAAALADADFGELDEVSEDPLVLVEMFLLSAEIDNWAGPIRNPFGALPDAACHWFADVPDPEVADRLRSGVDLDFSPDADLIRLWENAYLRGTGVDPKRPFGSGNVSRDVRTLIDPDKKLKPKDFRTRMQHLESQMLLMLLRFVQAADLPLGTYARGTNGSGCPSNSLKPVRVLRSPMRNGCSGSIPDRCTRPKNTSKP